MSRTSSTARVALVAICVLAACDSNTGNLTVDLETDFIAGVEFTSVRVEVTEGAFASDAPLPNAIETVAGVARFVPGRRVGELRGLLLGDHLVRVRLLDALGVVLVTRLVRVQLRDSYALTVVVTRDCAGITCPEPGDEPALTTCLRGHCADPICADAEVATCPTVQCTASTDCVATSACVRPLCAEGACLQLADDSACAADERCDVTLGCVLRPGVEGDASLPDAGAGDACPPAELGCTNETDDDCDGLVDCEDPDCFDVTCDDSLLCTTRDRCGAGTCTGLALPCDDLVPCTVDACEEGMGCTHTASDALCTDMPGGTCDAVLGCQYPTCTPATCAPIDGCDAATCSGATCVHASTCTAAQTCCGGACRATSCDDGNPCTDDSFSTTTCACVHTNNSVTCNDGNACTTPDRCSAGRCTGPARSCDDSNTCTTDAYSTSTGCTHASRAAGTSCGGGNVCCSGACVSLATRAHCGSCGATCSSSRSCVTVPGRSGVYTCTCGANSECQGEGFGGMATCYSGYCDCQCAAASPTTCGGQCSSSASCHELSGHNYCQY